MSISTVAARRRYRTAPAQDLYRWLLGLIVPVVLLFGWHYPLLGYLVPVAMVTGMAGGFFRGRWVCGNLCPRGSFFDTWFSRFGRRAEIPSLFRNMALRAVVLAALMGFMVWQITLNPSDPLHWGRVFWQMCLVTTVAGMFFALLWRPRTWCSVCPVGTMQKVSGGRKHPLQVDASCRRCGLCRQACPMGIFAGDGRGGGQLQDGDCIRCSTCLTVCPEKSLRWP